jgi:hypothetical protein
MQPFELKCYRPGFGFPPSCFFILSRGNNTGRPSYKANVNCFVFSCAPQDLERYYWIVYALWYTRKLRPLLCGSVIPFIHIKDLKFLIAQAANHSHIDQALSTLQKFLELEIKLLKQVDLIKAGRAALLCRIDAPAA